MVDAIAMVIGYLALLVAGEIVVVFGCLLVAFHVDAWRKRGRHAR